MRSNIIQNRLGNTDLTSSLSEVRTIAETRAIEIHTTNLNTIKYEKDIDSNTNGNDTEDIELSKHDLQLVSQRISWLFRYSYKIV